MTLEEAKFVQKLMDESTEFGTLYKRLVEHFKIATPKGNIADEQAFDYLEMIERIMAPLLIRIFEAGRESILAELPGERDTNDGNLTTLGFNEAIKLVKNIIRERKV